MQANKLQSFQLGNNLQELDAQSLKSPQNVSVLALKFNRDIYGGFENTVGR